MPEMQGVLTREAAGSAAPTVAIPIKDLDRLPYPSFDDYYMDLAASGLALRPQSRVLLPFESSRGCWWGEKSQCTFCGLNGSSMEYRAKSAQRSLDELEWLQGRYKGLYGAITAVDKVVPKEYFAEFFPRVVSLQLNLNLHYEVRANLRKSEVEMLRRAGVTVIQPGIESLSTRLLHLMHKGVTTLQNVQLLKWCRQFGIRVYWNLLFGFPGETEEDYNQIVEVVHAISHLQPPLGVVRVAFERFSPYFNYPQAFQITDMHPDPSYAYVYPGLTPTDLNCNRLRSLRRDRLRLVMLRRGIIETV